MKLIQKEYKNLGFSCGPLQSMKPEYERSYGCFFTIMDERVAAGLVLYVGKSYISFWWLK